MNTINPSRMDSRDAFRLQEKGFFDVAPRATESDVLRTLGLAYHIEDNDFHNDAQAYLATRRDAVLVADQIDGTEFYAVPHSGMNPDGDAYEVAVHDGGIDVEEIADGLTMDEIDDILFAYLDDEYFDEFDIDEFDGLASSLYDISNF